VLPCLVVQGALFALGRTATVATALVAAAMLGLVVDNTIHLVHRWRGARARGAGPRLAAARALESAGGAVLRTSLCLAAGFGTGLVGGLSTSREFGALSAAIVLCALVACLVLLPALLLGPRRRRARGARLPVPKEVVRAAGAL
jgi:predicted RND superfamily exporter protein